MRKVKSFQEVSEMIRKKIQRKSYVVTNIFDRQTLLCDRVFPIEHDVQKVLLVDGVSSTIRNNLATPCQCNAHHSESNTYFRRRGSLTH